MRSKKEIVFFSTIVLFAITVSLVAYFLDAANPYNVAVRLLALNGFIAISIASILTAYLKEVTLFFKKPFTRIHHYFAAAGLVLITLHPIMLAVQLMNPAVFLPNINSLYLFLFFGGRQALIIIYIALAAVLLRRKISTYWRLFHALMYVALFFGIVHADLSGSDFENLAVLIIFNGLFIAVLAAFVYKRWQFYQMKTRNKKRRLAPQRHT